MSKFATLISVTWDPRRFSPVESANIQLARGLRNQSDSPRSSGSMFAHHLAPWWSYVKTFWQPVTSGLFHWLYSARWNENGRPMPKTFAPNDGPPDHSPSTTVWIT